MVVVVVLDVIVIGVIVFVVCLFRRIFKSLGGDNNWGFFVVFQRWIG